MEGRWDEDFSPSVLSDDDQQRSDRPRKRPRVDRDALETLLQEGGCTLMTGNINEESTVQDVRRLRRVLGSRLLLDVNLRTEVLQDLGIMLREPETLRHLLLPLVPETQDGNATGDSLMRILLTTDVIQAYVAEQLLVKLADDDVEQSLASLILSQFRWLDSLAHQQAISEMFLKAMDSCCREDLQKEIILLLPELLSEDEHEAFVRKLEHLCEANGSFLVPSLEAFATLCLGDELQESVIALILGRLKSAAVADLPAMLQHLLQHVSHANARQIARELRGELHFVSAADPRLAAVSGCEDGRDQAPEESPYLQALMALKAGLQASLAACEAFNKALLHLSEDDGPATMDAIMLMLLHSLGGAWRASTGAILKKKFASGILTSDLFRDILTGHQEELKDFFPTLLDFAEMLSSAAPDTTRMAGAALYASLFLQFESCFHRQEVLRCLHSHLGSGATRQASTALDALLQLLEADATALLSYAAFLTGMLEYLQHFSHGQVQQVCTLLSGLVVHSMVLSTTPGAGSQAVGVGSTYRTLLRKRLGSTELADCRSGIMALRCLVSRLAREELQADRDPPFQLQCVQEAMTHVRHAWQACQASQKHQLPMLTTMLCDELASMAQKDEMGPLLLGNIRDMFLQELESLLVDMDGDKLAGCPETQGGAGDDDLKAKPLLNLNGLENPIGLPVLHMLQSSQACKRHSAAYAPALLRLCSVIELRECKTLEAVTAILGCPVWLPALDAAERLEAAQLPASQQRILCQALWHTVNWLREVANSFSADAQGMAEDPDTLQKLVFRLQQLCQLEALLDEALAHAPPSFTIPTANGVLTPFADPQTSRKGPRKGQGTKKDGHLEEQAEGGGRAEEEAVKENLPPVNSQAHFAARLPGRLKAVCQHLRPLSASTLQLMVHLPKAVPAGMALAPQAYLLSGVLDATKRHLSSKSASPFSKHQHASQTGSSIETPMKTEQLLLHCMPPAQSLLQVAADHLRCQDGSIPEDIHAAAMPDGESQSSALLACQPGKAALASRAAAQRVAELSLQLLQAVAEFTEAHLDQHRPLLLATLRMGALQGTADPQALRSEGAQVSEQLQACCKSMAQLFEQGKDFDQDMLGIAVLYSLLQLAQRLEDDTFSETLEDMRRCISEGAGAMLSSSWDHCPGPAAQGKKGSAQGRGWAGRTGAMAALVKYHVELSSSSSDAIAEISQCLAASPVVSEEYTALTAATLPVWYKALLEVLQHQLELLSPRLQKADVQQEEDTCALLAAACSHAKAFSELMQVTKSHQRKQVLMQAVRSAAQIIDLFLKLGPCWKKLVAAGEPYSAEFMSISTELQKGTRTLQILCSEAKSKKELGIVAKVPQLKRRLEQLLIMTKGLLQYSGAVQHILVGNLRHKDLAGQVVPSQAYRESSSEEESDGEEDDAEHEPAPELSASRQRSPAAGGRAQVSAAAYAVKAESEEPNEDEHCTEDREGDL